MKKKALSLLIVISMVLTLIPANVITASASEGTCGDSLTWSLSDGTLTIAGTGKMTSFSKGNAPWNSYCGQITKVKIENGVTSIGSYAFAFCESLKEISIASSVESIERNILMSSNLVTSVTLPASLKKINPLAFVYADGLSSLQTLVSSKYFAASGGVLYTKDKSELVFYPHAKTSKSFSIANSVEVIGDYAFYRNHHIVKIDMAHTVRYIGDYAFSNCTALKEAPLSVSLTHMGEYAFADCSALSYTSIPDTMTFVPRAAYMNCSNLESVVLGQRVKEIESSAFTECKKLTEISFPNSVRTISDHAFSYSGLKKLHLGKNVNYLGSYAFGSCSSLTEFIAGPNLRTINGSFGNCRSLAYVNLKDCLETVDYASFEGCTALTKVNLTSLSLKYIGSNAFAYCPSLESVYLSDSVEEIKSSAFSQNDGHNVEIYYEGTYRDWCNIKIGSPYYLANANVNYECEANKVYTVKFNTNGGTGNYPDREVAHNAFMSAPKTPRKDGYVFDGWYANADFMGEPFITKTGKANRKVTQDITLYAKWAESPEFVWERDIFSFGNSFIFFGSDYEINDSYYHLLTRNLSKSQKRLISDMLETPFGGSCYGMVAVMMLAQTGDLTPSFFQKNASAVNDFSYPKDNLTVASLINYYYLSQKLPSYLNAVNPTIRPSTKTCAEKIVNALKNIDKTKNPVMINFLYKFSLLGSGGHSVLAYDIEDDGKQYVVSIADPNYLTIALHDPETGNSVIDPETGNSIFVNRDPAKMYISYDFSKIDFWDANGSDISTEDGTMRLCSVITDSSFFEEIDLQKILAGGADESSVRPKLSSANDNILTTLNTNLVDFTVSNGDKTATVTQSEADGDLEIALFESPLTSSDYSFIISGEDSYTLSPANDDYDSYYASFLYSNNYQKYISVSSENKADFEVSPEGTVRITSKNEGTKEIELSFEDKKFDSLKISAYVKNLEVTELADGSIYVSSDSSLAGTWVTVYSDMNEMPIYTDSDCTSFYITAIDDGYCAVAIDTGYDYIETPLTYTVTFVSMGGTEVESYTGVENLSLIEEPREPEYTGFIFDGWYTDEECTDEWHFNEDFVDKNLCLYAKWDEDSSRFPLVTFNNNGDVTQIIAKIGSSIPKSQYPELTPADDEVAYWEEADTENITGDVTVNAVYALKSEAVMASADKPQYSDNNISFNLSFERCLTDCKLVVDIYDKDEENIIQTSYIDIARGETAKAVEVPFVGDDTYHSVVLSFIDNETDKNPCGESVETWFLATLPEHKSGDFVYKMVGESLMLYGYEGNETELTIPETIDNHPVEIIGEYALSGLKLTKVTLPSTLRIINEGAFYQNSISDITIPGSVEKIEDMAFAECYNLETVNVSDKNQYYMVENNVLFDKDKTKIILYPAGKTETSYTIPGTVTELCESSFYGCRLQSISIPESLKYVGYSAFENCQTLTTVYYEGFIEQYLYDIWVESVNYPLHSAEVICAKDSPSVFAAVYSEYYDNKVSVSVDFVKCEEDGILVNAVYDDKNNLVAVNMTEHTTYDDTYMWFEMDVDRVCTGYTLKTCYWSENNNLRPVNKAKITVIE